MPEEEKSENQEEKVYDQETLLKFFDRDFFSIC
jgi:hypothetical protein